MQTDIPKHVSNKPQPAPEGAAGQIKLGQHLTLLDKTLSYFVSQRGANCFWARILNGCSIIVDPNLGTAGVELIDGGKKHAFLYDPVYFQNLTPANRRCTLVHEAVHVACLHVIRYMRLISKATDPKVRKAIRAVFNIAGDMEANDTYVRLEKDFKKTLKEGEFWHLPEQHDLPRGQSMETYVELLLRKLPSVVSKLKQMAQERKESGSTASGDESGRNQPRYGDPVDKRSEEEKAADTVKNVTEAAHKYEKQVDEMLGLHDELTNDTHERWMQYIEELAEKDPTKLEQLIEQARKDVTKIIEVAYNATQKLRGTVPGNMAAQLASLLMTPTVPWTELLRDWVLGNLGRNFVDTTRLPSLSLLNVEGIEPFPGQVIEPEVNVTWITDTSGSMTDKCFQKASSEMAHLIQQTKAIRVHHIQVDTVIQNETVHDITDDAITSQERHGYGGTTLKAAFARAVGIDLELWSPNATRQDEVRPPDLMVVYTDGFIEDMGPVMAEFHPGCPTLWLISPNGQTPAAIARIGMPHVVIHIPNHH